MKRKIIIAVIVVLLALGLVVASAGYWLVGKVIEAQGRALYAGSGAWSRVLEYAKESGIDIYVQEAEQNVFMFEDEIADWNEAAPIFLLDPKDFKSEQTKAYEVTDRNIKNGQNPLAYLDSEIP